jgi:hypothetical protein
MERFNIKKLNEVEGKEQDHVEVSNRFAALEDLDTEVEINSAWETIRKNINISAKECGNLPQSSFTLSASLRQSCRLANQHGEQQRRAALGRVWLAGRV